MRLTHKFCLGLLIITSSALSFAKKAPKPTMCDDFEELKTSRGTIALCHGDRPKVLVRYQVLSFPDGRRVAVGYSTVE